MSTDPNLLSPLNSSSWVGAIRCGEASMFDRLVEDFCQFDDFCQAFGPHWEALLLGQGAQPAKKRGAQAGLADSAIMTILVLYHSSHFRHFKAFYEGIVLTLLRSAFPKAPCPLHRFDQPCVG